MKKLLQLLSVCVMVLVAVPVSAQVITDSSTSKQVADTSRVTQVADSARSNYFAAFNLASDIKPAQIPQDSILLNAFFYDKVKQQELYVPVAGNPGAASLHFFDDKVFNKIFTDGFNQFDPYLKYPIKNFPEGNAERRLTNLDYHLGTKKEQHILVKHEQKIKPWFIVGLDFGALTAPGDFSRTLNTNRNLDIYLGYETPSKLYRSYVSFTSNRVENEENGGISNDSIFENASSLNTRTLPINLPNAMMTHRSRDYVIKQDLNLTRLFHKADSLERTREFEAGSFVLNYSVWWSRKYTLFTSTDADSGYFENYYVDTTLTYDSTFYNDLYQVAMLEYTTVPSASGTTFRLGGGFEYQQNEYETLTADTTVLTGVDTSFKSGAVVVSAGFNSNRLHGNLFYSQPVYGDLEKSYRAKFTLDYNFGQHRNLLYLKINAGKIAHTAKEMVYVSNHFYWENDFALLEQYDVTGGVSLSKYKTSVEVRNRNSKNLIFYREDYLPQAYGNYIAVTDITLSNSFMVKKFGLDTKLTFSFSGNENVVPVSPFALFSSIYYQNRFFKNVLGFKAGFDVSYYSEYYGYGYMPATGIFYLQQDKKIGNAPLVGVFVNLKIKSKATLFIRLDHANAGLGERNYYGAYHYPLSGRTIKFGVSWDLID